MPSLQKGSKPAPADTQIQALARLEQMSIGGIKLRPGSIALLRLQEERSTNPDPLVRTWKMVRVDDSTDRRSAVLDHDTAIKLISDLTAAGFSRCYFPDIEEILFWSSLYE